MIKLPKLTFISRGLPDFGIFKEMIMSRNLNPICRLKKGCVSICMCNE